MSQVGSILLEARKKKGVDLAQVEQETNIEKAYIDALEKDDYQKIPAEAYIIGFLRNYSEYLGLDANEIIRQYKNIKIEAIEVPQEVLLPPKHNNVLKIVLLVFLSLFIILGVYLSLMLFFSYRSITKDNIDENVASSSLTNRVPMEYEISPDTQVVKEVFKGDKLKANIDEKEYVITILDTYPTLRLELQGLGEREIDASETKLLDLNDDAIMDIELTANNIAEREGDGVSISIASGSDISAREPLESGEVSEIVDLQDRLQKKSGEKVLFTSPQAYPIVLNVEFSGYCLFRVDIDKNTRRERFYQKGERLSNIRAQNIFRVWASNGFVTKCTLVGSGGLSKDLGFIGKPGEVVVKDYKWRQNTGGGFSFIELDVD